MIKKVAILVNGGDCSGINPVIRAIVKTCRHYGIECYGFIEGYKGLVENNYIRLDGNPIASGIICKGGSIIGSSINTIVFNYKVTNDDGSTSFKDLSDLCIQNVKDDGFDCVFTIGGDSTQKSARDLFVKGLPVIGVPKTIDNDVACTEVTFGYDTAVSVAAEAIDRVHSTAETHHRIMVIEVMGRSAGWIAIESAIAGGADACLIPEIPYDINKVAEAIKRRRERGKNFSVVVVAEAATPISGETETQEYDIDKGTGIAIKYQGAGDRVAKELEKLTGLSARNTTLGYIQRGGVPTSHDRVISAKYGCKAVELALEGKFGTLTVIKDGKMDCVSLEDVVGNNKELGSVEGGTADSNVKKVEMEGELVKTAKDLDICLGD